MAVVESKFMWIGKDGRIHYISKADYDKVITVAEKVVDKAVLAVVVGVVASSGNLVFAADVAKSSAAEVAKAAAIESAKNGNSIMIGLAPLIKLIGDIAEPVTYGYMVKGFLKFTQGKEEEAKKTLVNAGTGFLGCKFTPQVINFLSGLKLFV